MQSGKLRLQVEMRGGGGGTTQFDEQQIALHRRGTVMIRSQQYLHLALEGKELSDEAAA